MDLHILFKHPFSWPLFLKQLYRGNEHFRDEWEYEAATTLETPPPYVYPAPVSESGIKLINRSSPIDLMKQRLPHPGKRIWNLIFEREGRDGRVGGGGGTSLTHAWFFFFLSLGPVFSVQWSNNGNYLATTTSFGIIRLWETNTWKLAQELRDKEAKTLIFSVLQILLFSTFPYNIF